MKFTKLYSALIAGAIVTAAAAPALANTEAPTTQTVDQQIQRDVMD